MGEQENIELVRKEDTPCSPSFLAGTLLPPPPTRIPPQRPMILPAPPATLPVQAPQQKQKQVKEAGICKCAQHRRPGSAGSPRRLGSPDLTRPHISEMTRSFSSGKLL